MAEKKRPPKIEYEVRCVLEFISDNKAITSLVRKYPTIEEARKARQPDEFIVKVSRQRVE
jgi:hypothetical protein